MSLANPKTAYDLLNYRLNRLLASSGAPVIRLCEGRYGITRREWRLIAVLAEQGPMSPSSLAKSTHLERARVSALITHLVEKKLLLRMSVDGDGRRAEVALSPEGRSVYDELIPLSMKLQEEMLDVLTACEREYFDAALSKLTDAAERMVTLRPIAEKADRQHGGSRRVRRG
ncbi:MarR family winged helix-turn-helix transcriptional regulator [Hydrogenophaga sp.]|uniref:MarR family winged helix-turn-helix transcriptional regulator n=1 Tax=Hydrogenophaga sp. TaxID=1904254 RepID=UPI003F70BC99